MDTVKESFTKQTKEEIIVDEEPVKVEKDKEESAPLKAEQNGNLKSTN